MILWSFELQPPRLFSFDLLSMENYMLPESSPDQNDISDYEFWRSQHDSANSNGPDKSHMEVFSRALFNRLGEEVGQNLNRLFWPEIPSGLKKTVGSLVGKLAPVVFAGTALSKTVSSSITANSQVFPKAVREFSLIVDGEKQNSPLQNWGEFFSCLDQAQGYWLIKSKTSRSFLRFKIDQKNSQTCLEKFTEAEWDEGADFLIEDPTLWKRHEEVRKFVKAELARSLVREMKVDFDSNVSELGVAEKQKLMNFLITMRLLEENHG